MKPIRSIGAAVVALAAPGLFTLPAAASTRSVARVETLLGSDTKLTLAIGSGYDDYHRDVEIDHDVYIRQVGPRGFFVTLGEGDFEGRRRDMETRVLCQIGRGSVITFEGIPHPSKSQRYGRGW